MTCPQCQRRPCAISGRRPVCVVCRAKDKQVQRVLREMGQ